jgi:hypothetical protein
VDEKTDEAVEGTLLDPGADVRSGVPIDAFREAICAAAARTASDLQLAGELVIDRAAYSDRFSGLGIFRWLAGTVVALLALPSLPHYEEEVVQALASRLSPASIFDQGRA